jgi:hypothetical protein
MAVGRKFSFPETPGLKLRFGEGRDYLLVKLDNPHRPGGADLGAADEDAIRHGCEPHPGTAWRIFPPES